MGAVTHQMSAMDDDLRKIPAFIRLSRSTASILTQNIVLALGIKGIHLGPTLPAFLTPTLLAVLQEKFDLRANGDAAADVARALGQAA